MSVFATSPAPYTPVLHTPTLYMYPNLYLYRLVSLYFLCIVICVPRHFIKACFVLSVLCLFFGRSIDIVGSVAREATTCGEADGGARPGPRGCPEPGAAAAEEHQRGNYLHRHHVRTAALCGQIATLSTRQEVEG